MPRRIGASFTPQQKKRKYDDLFAGVANGEVWLLEGSKDYSCADGSLRDHARAYAERNGLDCAVNVVRRDGRAYGVEVAFVPKGQPLPHVDAEQAEAA